MIQFGEEELEHKLSTSGLTPQEQQMFEDLHTIRDFLESFPTQLTEHGLKVLHEYLMPGSFSILFRNDHFSTIYREQKSGQVLTLVTDAGYSSHDEIVWESLVDVSGQGSELFSGDFRPVSHNAPTASSSAGPSVGPRSSSQQQLPSLIDMGEDSDWKNVRNGRNNQTGNTDSTANASSNNRFADLAAPRPFDEPNTEEAHRSMQEDHDLALALQLQEEEEENARRDRENRERQDRLSRQVLDGQGRPNAGSRVNIPVTSSSRPPPTPARRPSAPSGLRPVVPPRRNQDDPSAPPSYEQAQNAPAFVPPANHPASPNAPLPGQGGSPFGRGRGGPSQSYSQPPMPGQMGRGQPVQQFGRADRDKCTLM